MNGDQSIQEISDEQLQVIGKRYEYLRRKKLYTGNETKRVRYEKKTEFVRKCTESIPAQLPKNRSIQLELKIRFPWRREKNSWQEYGNSALRLYRAFAARSTQQAKDSPVIELSLCPYRENGGDVMGYRIVCCAATHSEREEEESASFIDER